jgi:hypothetical protein
MEKDPSIARGYAQELDLEAQANCSRLGGTALALLANHL